MPYGVDHRPGSKTDPSFVKGAKARLIPALFLIGGLIPFSLPAASFATSIAGNITGTLAAFGNPYIATGSVVVPLGQTLTLEEGVILKMAPGTQFTVNGVLVTQGTPENPVTLTSLADDSIGGDSAGDGPTLGAPGQWGTLVFNGSTSSTRLSNTTIRFGSQVTLTAASPQFADVTISSLSVVAVSADLASSPTGSGNQAFGSPVNGIDRIPGPVTSASVWANLGIPYVIRSGGMDLGVPLTIAPGVVVKLRGSNYLQMSAPLTAVGTSSAPIIFTSLRDDSAGGNTNPFEGVVAPAPGDWRTIFVSGTGASGSRLSNVQFRYGGAVEGSSLYVNGANVTVTNSRVSASSVDGIVFVSGGAGLVQGTTFQSNARWGIQTQGLNAGMVTLADNLFDGNGGGIWFANGTASPVLKGNVFQNTNGSVMRVGPNIFLDDQGGNVGGANNQINGIELTGGNWTQGGTLKFVEIPYVIRSGSVDFASGAPLTIVPGVVVKLRGSNYLQMSAPLTAVGTSSAPIIFTSLRDDSAGGNTNLFEGAVGPAPGDWRTIFVSGTGASGSRFDAVQFRYGGAVEGASLYVNGANVTVTNSRIVASSVDGIVFTSGGSGSVTESVIENNARWGIQNLSNTPPVVQDSTLSGNGSAGVANNNPTRLDAVGDYWGSPTGPTHSGNPGGTGDKVIGNVNYVPFLIFPPHSDTLAPRTELLIGNPKFDLNFIFVKPETPLGLISVDDRATIGDGQGVGVKESRISLNGLPFVPYSGPFSFSTEGQQMISWFSEDLDGHVEVIHSTAVWLDLTPPMTTLIWSTASVITPSTAFSLDAQDPVSNGAASGLHQTFLSIDDAPFVSYTSPFALVSTGTHTLQWYSDDNVGNVEAVKSESVTVRVDSEPPVTQIHYSRPSLGTFAGYLYLSSATQISFTAQDFGTPVSGVAWTRFSLDGAPDLDFVLPFNLSEGVHALVFQSQDVQGNLEAPQSVQAAIDITPPVTALIYSSGVITTSTTFTLTVQDPLSNGVASGVLQTFLAIDGGGLAAYSGPFTLSSEGSHTLQWYSQDNVGNIEELKSESVTVAVDTVPPVTQIQYSLPPLGVISGTLYLSSATQISLTAQDFGTPVSGVALTQWSLDSVPFQNFVSPFGLSEGVHVLVFQSQDVIGNLEVPQTVSLAVDQTPPVSSLQVGTATYAAGSAITVSTMSLLLIRSTDSLSGVASTFYAFDSGAFQPVGQNPLPVPFVSGTHTLAIYSTDAVGNKEVVKTYSLTIPVAADSVPPVTQIQFTLSPYSANGVMFISTFTRIGFTAQDAGMPASGVAFTQYALGNGTFNVFTTSFTLTEGAYNVRYRSQDRAGNLEVTRTATVHVDKTAPISDLVVGEPKRHLIFGFVLITPTTPLTISALDPVSHGVASGVKEYWVAIDAQPFKRVNGTFFLTGPQSCIHLVRYYSRDNVLNAETPRLALVIVLPSPHQFSSSIARTRGYGTLSAEETPPPPEYMEGSSTVSYQLELAPGWNAQAGFVPMTNEWDLLNPAAVSNSAGGPAAAPYTVRLRVSDSEGNSNVDAENTVDDLALSTQFLAGFFGAPTPEEVFVQRSVFVFPSPARADAKPTIHVEVGLADEVQIRIFDAAGRPVKTATLAGTPTLISGQYAYEYLWDGHIPSGVYFYTVRAKKAGFEDLTSKGKFAVVR